MIRRFGLILTAALFMTCAGSGMVSGATFQTKNFTVSTSDPRVAEEMAVRAEDLRTKLAVFWLGKELPNWYKRCKIKIKIGNVPASGQTTFVFNNGEVYDWNMEINGTVERVYDSVLPHEITHMLMASHFRAPVPRWADEGAATFTEHKSERNKYRQQLYMFLRNRNGIPFDKLFAMGDYPEEPLPLYAHGFSVTEFLIRQRGPHYFVFFTEACMAEDKPLDDLVYNYYGYESLGNLQSDWLAWVEQGSPDFVGTNLVAGYDLQTEKRSKMAIPRYGEGADVFEDSMDVVPPVRKNPPQKLIIWSTANIQTK